MPILLRASFSHPFCPKCLRYSMLFSDDQLLLQPCTVSQHSDGLDLDSAVGHTSMLVQAYLDSFMISFIQSLMLHNCFYISISLLHHSYDMERHKV